MDNFELDDVTFVSEWLRVTRITRARNFHEQLLELDSIDFRLELTVAERATIQGRELQERLWRTRRGE